MSSKTDKKNAELLEFVRTKIKEAEENGESGFILNIVRFPDSVYDKLKSEFPSLQVRCNTLNYAFTW